MARKNAEDKVKKEVGTQKAETEQPQVFNNVVEVKGPVSIIPSKEKLDQLLVKEQETEDVIDKFRTMLVEGMDYGTIKMTKTNRSTGKDYEIESKPSLFKPGAEKFNRLFNARAKYERDNDTWEMLGMKQGVICFRCIIVDEYENYLGEGKGVAIAKYDEKYGYGDFETNKQVKISKKRAYVDATLTTYGLSEYFTQDMEDMPKDAPERKPVDNSADETQYSDEQQAQFRYFTEKVKTSSTKPALDEVEKEVMADSTLDGKMKHTVRTQIEFKRKVTK